jgi:hypothetical protein
MSLEREAWTSCFVCRLRAEDRMSEGLKTTKSKTLNEEDEKIPKSILK